jgi:PA14 domain
MVLVFVAGYLLARQALPPFGLHARYFSTDNWSGSPVLEVVDREMSGDVLFERTTEFLYRYTVEWSGCLVVHNPGRYTLATTSDDGSQLFVDDRPVVFNAGVHGLQKAEGQIDLARGVHPIRLQYLQNGGPYALMVEWARDGERLAALTNWSLVADNRSYLGFWLLLFGPVVIGLLSAAILRLVLARVWSAEQRWARTAAAAHWQRLRAWLERPIVAIAILIVVGGSARVLMLLGSTGILWPDSEVYYYNSQQILAGDFLQHDAFRTLAYPYFLAAFRSFGQTPAVGTAIVATQHALGLIAAIVFYLAGRRAFTPLVAFFAALLFSIHALELFYEASILSESLFVVTLSLVILEVIRLRSSTSVVSPIWIGALCVLLTMVRPIGQWFVLCVLPVLWASIPMRRRALTAMAVVVAVNVMLLLPWMEVNRREFGFFGVNVGLGMGLFRTAYEIDKLPLPETTRYPVVKQVATEAAVLHWSSSRVRDELNYQFGRSEYETDRELLGFSLEGISREPFRFAIGFVRQEIVQLGGSLRGIRTCASPSYGPYLCSGRMLELSHPEFPNAPTRANRRLREWLVMYMKFGYVRMSIVLGFAVLGVAAYFFDSRHRNPAGLLKALTICYMTAVTVLVEWPQDRFRLPVDALLFMFAAWGVRALLVEAPRAALEARQQP